MFEVSMEDLKKVFIDFYNLTKFEIALYDSDKNFLYAYPEKMCTFCSTVRTVPALAKKCIASDSYGFTVCDKTRKPYIYKCHMSIIEAITPIYSNGITVGYLMFGQILENGNTEFEKTVKRVSEKFGLGLTRDMIEEMTAADEGYIHSALSIMSMCANHLYTDRIIRSYPNIFVYQLEEYVSSHLDGDLSVNAICEHFFISRTKLYSLAKKNFRMGISDYIRIQRIKAAKKLLSNTDDSVSQIAATVGLRDTNYFIRAFKQLEGITPLQFRRLATKHIQDSARAADKIKP